MTPLRIRAENPDVAGIMRELRRLIRESGGGGPSPEEEERLFTRALAGLGGQARLGEDFLEQVRAGGSLWNVIGDFPLASHRRGPAGWAVALLKRLFRPPLRLLLSPLLYRQAEVNRYCREILHHLLRESIRLRMEVETLRRASGQRAGPGRDLPCEEALDRLGGMFVVVEEGPAGKA